MHLFISWSLSVALLLGGKPRRPVQPLSPEEAEKLCRPLEKDKVAHENCVFDVTATGNPGLAEAYVLALKLRTPAP